MHPRLINKVLRRRREKPALPLLGDGLDEILVRLDRPADNKLRLARYLRARYAFPARSPLDRKRDELPVLLGRHYQRALANGERLNLPAGRARRGGPLAAWTGSAEGGMP